MKKLVLFFALALCIGIVYAQSQNTSSLAIGTSLPEAREKLRGTDNNYYTLQSQLTPKGLIVMFSCNTCPYVIRSQQRTKETIAMARQNGIGILIVNSNTAQRDDADSYEAMVKYGKAQGYTVPYVVDEGKLVTAFGATRTPEVFLFDGTGKLVYKGAMEDNPSSPSESKQFFLKNAVANLMTGKAVDPNSTKSIGCSIKR